MVTQAEIDIVIAAKNTATAELTKLKSSFGSVTTAAASTAASVQKVGSQFNTTKGTTGALAASLGSVGSQAKSAAGGLDDSAKSAKSADSGFASVTKSAAAFGVGMVGAGSALSLFQSAVVGSIKSAQDLEKAVLNISTIKPEIDTKAVSASLLDMSTRVAQSSSQLADSLYNIFSSIELSQEDALALTEKFARGAVAAQTDAETFGTAVLGVMNAYKLSVGDADHISDVFFNTVNKGVITAQQLAANLGPVTQSAKAAGVSLDELGAFIAAVTKEGGDAAQNVNNLNNLLMKVTTTDAQKQLKALQIETTTATGEFRPLAAVLGDLKVRLSTMTEAAQLAAIQKIFPDIQARQGAQTIMSQIDLVNEAIETNKTQAGSAGVAYDKMAGSGAASTQIFLNNLSKIGTELAQKVTPALADATTGMTEFIQAMGGGEQEGKGGWIEFFARSAQGALDRFMAPAKLGVATLEAIGNAGSETADQLDGTAAKVYDLNAAQLAAIPATQGQVDALRAQAQALQTATPAVQGFNLETVGMVEVQGQALTANERLGAVFGITAETTEELVKEVAKLKGGMEEATKIIKGYADAATPMTEAASRQDAALKGVVSQAEAMATVKLGPQMQEWAARAHELADASGTTGKPLADLHTSIAMIAQGGPGAAQGVENLKKQVEGISAPTQAAAAADRDYLTAQGELQQSLLRTPALVNDLVASMKNFVNEFLVAIGRVPAGAKQAIQLTEQAVTIDLSKPGADLAISLANGFGRETIRIVDASGNVIREVKGTLSAADMSPEGVAFMHKVAEGIATGGLTVQESARKVLTDAGVVMNTEAATAVANTNATLSTTGADEAVKTAVKEQATGIGKVIDPALAFEVTAAVQNANATLTTVGDEATRTTVKTNATSAGTDFSTGWKQGVESIDIIEHARGIFNGVVGAVKGILGEHSPSSVMDESGRNFIQGFINGTSALAPDLIAMVEGLASKAFDKFKSTLGSLGGAVSSLFGGGDGSGAYTATSSGANVDLGRQLAAAYGWTGAEFDALNRLWTQESGWNPNAVNPSSGAAGIPQALGHALPPGYAGNPSVQIAWGLDYIRGRYGSPSAALAWEQSHGWYAKGVQGLKAGQGWVGEEGPERFSLSPTNGLTIYPHDLSMAMSGGRVPGYAGGTVSLTTAPIGGGLSRAGLQVGGGELGGVFDEDTLFQIAKAVERFNALLREGQFDVGDYDAYLANLADTFAKLNQGQIGRIVEDFSLLTTEVQKMPTALDGARVAWAEFQRTAANTEAFGTGAGVIDSLLEAISANTPEAGARAVEGLQSFLAGLPDTLAPEAQEAGNYLRFILFQALDPANSEDREMLLGRFSQVFADIQAQGVAAATLSADTYASAYATALSSVQLTEKVGPTFKQFFDLLATQAKDGSAETIAQIGALSVGIEREIGKLPDVLRGPLLQDWQAAWGAFFESGDISQLEDVATRANRALTLIPKGFLDATPELQQAILDIIDSMDTLGLTSEEAAKRIEQATKGAAEGAARAAQTAKDTAAIVADQIKNTPTEPNMLGLPTSPSKNPGTPFPATGGGGGNNTKAEMFAAAVASPGGWTSGLASAWFEGLQSIVDEMQRETEIFQQILAQMERVKFSGELARFAAWVKEFGDQWLKVILETQGAEAAFQAFHGRSSASIPMVGAGAINNPDAVVQRLDQLIVAVEAMADRPVYVSPAEVGRAARDYETEYYRSRH